jgi:hypothetical protein
MKTIDNLKIVFKFLAIGTILVLGLMATTAL